MKFIIEENVINQILEYLKTKPYQEVAHLFDSIKNTVKLFNEPSPTAQPEPPTEGSDVQDVQSTQTESTQSQTSDEGGNEVQQQEPEVSQ